MLLKVLLFGLLGFVVNQIHFNLNLGVPGLVPVNILFLLVLLAMRGKPDPVGHVEPILKPALLFFFAVITFGFIVGQARVIKDFVEDATLYKNALFFPLFYFVYLYCKQDEKTTRWLIIWVMVIASVAGLEAIREGISYGFDAYSPFKRASGPFGEDWHNANRAGVFYGMFTPMFIALALFLKKKKLWTIAAIGGAATTAGGALFTYSRQAYFLVVLAFAVLIVRRSVVLAVLMGVLAIGAVGFLPEAATQRAAETKQENKDGAEEVDASTSSRWEIWGGAMQMLAAHPIGVGFNRFRGEIGNYCNHPGYDAHNFYVLILAECGPLGIAGMLFLVFTCFKLAKFLRANAPPDDSETHALTLGFTVCTLCMALGAIYGSPTLEGPVMAPYWSLCGLLERYIHLKALNRGQQPVAMPSQASIIDRFPLARFLPRPPAS